MISHNVKQVEGFDKELLLIGEGYIARPVTVDKSTITGLMPTEGGRYIIPQGTYLKGKTESLLAQPQQVAVKADVSVTKAKVTLLTHIEVSAKQEGNITHQVEIAAGTGANEPLTVTFDTAAKKLKVKLGTNAKKAVVSTLKNVVDAINNDMIANTYVKATLKDESKADDVAGAANGALAGGGAESVTGFIDGILYHSVDVTDGENTGAMIIGGYIDIDKMPTEPGKKVKEALPNIKFGRKD